MALVLSAPRNRKDDEKQQCHRVAFATRVAGLECDLMVCFDKLAGGARIREHIDRGTGKIQYIFDGEILVENLSYNKSLGFRVNVDGNWKDIYTAHFLSLLILGGNSMELWKTKQYGELLKQINITTPTPPKPIFRFAVFYHNLDSGQWYWDSNNGQDYFVQTI
jgi:hypothetical protein